MPGEFWLVRHGETEWSRSGAHTGRTDLPLTEAGREEAAAIARRLAGKRFALVLTACWLALPPASARLFALSTASLSTLGYERETRVITRWNQTCAPGS